MGSNSFFRAFPPSHLTARHKLEWGWNAHEETESTRPRKRVKKGARFFLMVVVVVVVVVVKVVVYGLEEWCHLSLKILLFSEVASKAH